MAVNIKNGRVEQLLNEVSALTGESKTETIRRALEERRERLTSSATLPSAAVRLRRVLEREIWPMLPPDNRRKPLSKTDEEAILGYGPDGV